MNGNNSEAEQPAIPEELPENAIVITQVNWAWLWASTPWLIVLAILSTIGIDPLFGSLIALIIIVPRFLAWKRTAYIVTDDGLIYQRGGFTGTRSFTIPMSKIVDVRSRDGMFGRGLGYQAVDVMLDNRGVASLTYVPTLAQAGELIRERTAPFEGERGDDTPGFGKPRRQEPTEDDLPDGPN